MEISVRPAVSEDWLDIKRIYEEGLETKMATFETKAPESYDKWFGEANPQCSLVAYDGKQVLGWCKLTPVSKRSVYKGVGEVSVYIASAARGKGIGQSITTTSYYRF